MPAEERYRGREVCILLGLYMYRMNPVPPICSANSPLLPGVNINCTSTSALTGLPLGAFIQFLTATWGGGNTDRAPPPLPSATKDISPPSAPLPPPHWSAACLSHCLCLLVWASLWRGKGGSCLSRPPPPLLLHSIHTHTHMLLWRPPWCLVSRVWYIRRLWCGAGLGGQSEGPQGLHFLWCRHATSSSAFSTRMPLLPPWVWVWVEPSGGLAQHTCPRCICLLCFLWVLCVLAALHASTGGWNTVSAHSLIGSPSFHEEERREITHTHICTCMYVYVLGVKISQGCVHPCEVLMMGFPVCVCVRARHAVPCCIPC